MRVEIDLLGGFAVRLDGRPVPSGQWHRRQAAALVKLLALAPRRTLHREQVIDALWPGTAVDDAAPRLHKAAYYARRALGGPRSLVLAADRVTDALQKGFHTRPRRPHLRFRHRSPPRIR